MKDVLSEIEWTNDCQGKQDFDGEILTLSSRYWPQGGGYWAFDQATGKEASNEDRPEILPSATSSILLLGEEIASQDFKANTEAEVKAQVEAWARGQIERVIRIMKAGEP